MRNLSGLGSILGINRRNRELVYPLNHRALCRVADDKLKAREALESAGLPMPDLVDVIRTVGQIRPTLRSLQAMAAPYAIKPARGSGGRGIFFMRAGRNGGFERLDGEPLHERKIRLQLSTILAGEFSLRAGMDQAVIEGYIHTHPEMKTLTPLGAPDIRILIHRGYPILAMARIPTNQSGGRGNLHQGAIGVGIKLATGRGFRAVHGSRTVPAHPDTNTPVDALKVPFWQDILALSKSAAQAIPLGYSGLDVMVDEKQGPVIVEINAHPGLAIQLANGVGLRSLL